MKPWLPLLLLTGLSLPPSGVSLAAVQLPVFVSILPQQYFVQQIGGDHVTVQVMVAPGASPATYEPKPRQMAALAAARLYFAVGVPFEAAWLDRITAASPDMRVIRTDQGIRKRVMASHHHDGNAASPGDAETGQGVGNDRSDDGDPHAEEAHAADTHDHGHGILDPHIWLSPPLVKIQAAAIRDALAAADPEHAADYDRNCRRFMEAVDALDRDLKTIFEGRAGRRFMVFHPSWGYFADAYNLEQVPVETEGKDPKAAQLTSLIEHAREHGIRVIFVQPQFSTRSAKLLADAIDGEVVFADPLAPDWADNLRAVAAKVAAALR